MYRMMGPFSSLAPRRTSVPCRQPHVVLQALCLDVVTA